MHLQEELQEKLKDSLLNQIISQCKGIAWAVFIISSGINILVLFLPIYTSQVLDRVLSSGSTDTLIMLSIITFFSFICSSLLESSRQIMMIRINDWLDTKLAPYFVKKAVALTTLKPDTSSGSIIRDLMVVRNTITGSALLSLLDAPWSIFYLLVIFTIHPVTGIICLVGICILVSIGFINDRSTKKLLRESDAKNIKNINSIEVATRNAEVLESMGMTDSVVDMWAEKNNQIRQIQMKATSRSALIMGITKVIRSTLQISVIGIGAYLAISGVQTAGGIIAASILMGRTLAPFEMLISNWKNLSEARYSYLRLQKLAVMAPSREESMKLPDPEGRITFDRVIYTPQGSNRPILKGISFSIDTPGTIVGVIGHSASGKSTLAKLMVGVYKPLAGTVRLDGANVYLWERKHFGCHVGYLPQDVELFNASIKQNIARMSKDIDPDLVVEAAKAVGTHEMILQFPNGYDTIIGGEGNGLILSGGQKQLIGLSRAFYGKISLIVLDEPNSSLDALGESRLIQSLKYAKENRKTLFMLTHKMSLLSHVDVIIVLKDGMVTAMGDRDQIIERLKSVSDK